MSTPPTLASSERLVVGRDELLLHVTSADSAGAVLAATVRMAPGGGPPALHRHDPFELYRVDRGELAFYLADDEGRVRRRVATAGEVVAIAGGREHTIRNESTADAEAFVVFSPGAPMEAFARAAGDGPADPQAVAELAARHGITLTRPLEEVA